MCYSSHEMPRENVTSAKLWAGPGGECRDDRYKFQVTGFNVICRSDWIRLLLMMLSCGK